MMDMKPWLGQSSTLLLILPLLLSAPVSVTGDDRIGYYVTSNGGSARVASCNYQTTLSHRWSSVGSMGVCVETESKSGSGALTTNYYLGESCNGTSAFGHYLATADDGRSATVTVSFPCDDSCETITVFSAASATISSVSFIGCPEQLGLPPQVRTVYADLALITDSTGSKSTSSTSSRSTASSTGTAQSGTAGTTSPPQTTPTKPKNETSEGPMSESQGGSSNTPVIVGAVVGSIGGIALILLAFFLGRRHAAKKRPIETITPTTSHQVQDPSYYHKAELEETPAPGAAQHFASSQADWITQQQQQRPPVWELPSNHPAAHQLSAERGPYEVPEVPGSYGHSSPRQG